jgi:hypothetical protein
MRRVIGSSIDKKRCPKQMSNTYARVNKGHGNHAAEFAA